MHDKSGPSSKDTVAAPADADVRWKLLAELIRRGDTGAISRIISSSKGRPGADWLAYWSRISLPDYPDTAHLLADFAVEADIASSDAHIAKAHAYAATDQVSAAIEHYELAKAIDPESRDIHLEYLADLENPELPAEESEETIDEQAAADSGSMPDPETAEEPTGEEGDEMGGEVPITGDRPDASDEEAFFESEKDEKFPSEEKRVEEEIECDEREDFLQSEPVDADEIPVEHSEVLPLAELDLEPHWNLNTTLQIAPLAPLIAPESLPNQHLPAFQKSDAKPARLHFAGLDAPEEKTQRVLALPVAAPESHPTLPTDTDAGYFPGDPRPDEVVLLVADSGVIPKLPQKSVAKERVSATLTTILVHIAFFILLALIIITIPNKKPPEIIATTASQTKTDSVKRKVSRSVRSNPSPPSQSNLAVIAVAATSQVVAPTVEFDPTQDTLNLGTSFGAGNAFGGGPGSGGTFGVPAAMKSRCSAQERAKMLAKHGGNRATESAIVRGLNWIALQQNKDGSWGKKYKCAMTGLALLAFLGHCETPDSERYGRRVMKGIMYLVEVSKKKRIYATAGGHSASYEHGIATYALGESYAIARLGTQPLPGMRDAFVKGTTTIIRGQNPDGGWSYGYPRKGASDISVTGWQYQALKAAKHTKIKIDGLDASIQKAQAFLAGVQDRNSGGFPYRPGGSGKRTLSAAGVLGLQMLGGEEKFADNIERGLRFALGDLHEQTWRNANIYTWYYNTQACFQFGGNPWDHWNKMFSKTLTLNQSFDGAWDGAAGSQAGSDASFYTTCLSVLMLEVYYRYLPTSG